MTIYIDLVFLLNLFFDFSLLLTVNNTLKRNVALKKIFAGSLVGSLSFFTLFFSLNSVLLMTLKFVMAFLMVIVTFGLKDKKYTCFPTFNEEKYAGTYEEKLAVYDSGIVTGRGMGATIEFARILVKLLTNGEMTDNVDFGIQYEHRFQELTK